MKFFNKKIHIGTCFMISLAIAALTFTITAVTLLNFVNSRLESLSKKELEMGKIANVRSIIDEYYIGEPNESQMTESALYGYVAGIGDKYSRYYNAEEYAALTNQTSGKMVGIGVQSIMDKDTGFIKITEVFAGSPALKNDLRPGDLIYAVDGQNVLDIGYEAAITKIKGAKGDLVILSVQRGDKKLDISVIRDTVTTPSVAYKMLDGNLGYVKISEFSKPTFGELEIAIETLKTNGAVGLLFDVRNNPGGVVDSLAETLDYLLPEGETFRLVNKAGTPQIKLSFEGEIDLPMVILVNEDTASAAEVFSGVLQEVKGAKLIGKKTYGKWTSQNIIGLGDGTGLAISDEMSYTPAGKNYEGVGLAPDYEVDMPSDSNLEPGAVDTVNDPQLKKAVEVIQKELSEASAAPAA